MAAARALGYVLSMGSTRSALSRAWGFALIALAACQSGSCSRKPELIARQPKAGELRVDDTHVYAAGGASLTRMPKRGGSVSHLLESSPMFFVVDESDLYFVDRATHSVKRMAKGGGAPVSLATAAPRRSDGPPGGLAQRRCDRR
jgi:hypothetical protein